MFKSCFVYVCFVLCVFLFVVLFMFVCCLCLIVLISFVRSCFVVFV